MKDGTGLIYFRCAAPTHQKGAEGRTTDTLTVHQSKWSYCPMDVRSDGHQWESTGGVQIEMLRRGSPAINLDLDVRPRTEKPAAAAAASGATGTAKKAVEPRKRAPRR